MHYLKRLSKKNSENAVSPVVGVMLMLVVTIIIAAVVSAFSGGLIGQGTPKAPTLTMNVKVVNTGISATSGFFATVTGISNPVQTKNEELITSWQTTNRVTGAAITGGNTTIYVNGTLTAPLGYGPEYGWSIWRQLWKLYSRFRNRNECNSHFHLRTIHSICVWLWFGSHRQYGGSDLEQTGRTLGRVTL